MTKHKQFLLLLASLSILLIMSCTHQDSEQSAQLLEEGLQAYQLRDYPRAFSLLKPLAESGQIEAQRRLGVMYRHGLGVPRDDHEAMRWYQAAAEQGHVRAQNNLGIMYLFGLGTSADSDKAEHWLLAAAQQNDAKAQENLGIFYSNKNDMKAAVHYLTLAAEQEQVRAQLSLGLLTLAGSGTEKNQALAMRWIARAAHGGSPAAAQALAKAYADGLYGLPQDRAKAAFWSARAGNQHP